MSRKSSLAQAATDLIQLPPGVSGAALVANADSRDVPSFILPFVPIPLDIRCAEQLEAASRAVEEMDKLLNGILADPTDAAIEQLAGYAARLTNVLQTAMGSLDGKGYWWSLWRKSDVSRIMTLKQRYLTGTLAVLTAALKKRGNKLTPLARYTYFVKRDGVRNAWMTSSGLLRSRLRDYAYRLRERVRNSFQHYVVRDVAEQFALVSPETAARYALGLPVTLGVIDEIVALARDGADLLGEDASEIERMAKDLSANFAARKLAETQERLKHFRRIVASVLHPDRHHAINTERSNDLQARANVLLSQLEALTEETSSAGSASRRSVQMSPG